jgi:hypothetical protein
MGIEWNDLNRKAKVNKMEIKNEKVGQIVECVMKGLILKR